LPLLQNKILLFTATVKKLTEAKFGVFTAVKMQVVVF